MKVYRSKKMQREIYRTYDRLLTLCRPERVQKGISISGTVPVGENSGAFTANTDIMEHYTYLLKGFNNMTMGYHKVRNFTKEEVDAIRDK